METTYKLSKSQLIAAFKKWNDEYTSEPDEFSDSEENKAERQAETLLNYLEL